MLKNWLRDITLSVQAKSGATSAVFVWLAIVAVAGVTAFVFLCLTGYEWLSVHIGPVFAGLIMTCIFLLFALIGLTVAALARRHAKERAILERAARAHSSSWLLDPKIIGAAVQAGRAFGWQRVVPVALLGFMAAQWAREYRKQGQEDVE